MALNAAKIFTILVFSAAWWAVYDLANRRGSNPARAIHLSRPVDSFPWIIQPWTAPIYVIGGGLLPLLPLFYYWSWPRLRFVLSTYAIAAVPAFCFYALWPVAMVRPAMTGTSAGERVMRMVFAVDKEANCFPSSHVFLSLLAALLVRAGGATTKVQVATWVLTIIVCVTTLTTGQHYFVDVLGGGVVAVTAYAVARRLFAGALAGDL